MKVHGILVGFALKVVVIGIPGWRSGLAPAFGPGHDPGDLGSNPMSGSRYMEPASRFGCLSLSLCDYNKKKDLCGIRKDPE